jgi:L-amino acid N-acyltransferase YncA
MGVATALMKALLTKLEKSNVMQAQLQVTINPANDETAINVYKRLGFKQCGTYSNDIVVNGNSYSSVMMEKGIGEKSAE